MAQASRLTTQREELRGQSRALVIVNVLLSPEP